MTGFFAAFHVLLSFGLITLVLLHSGRDAGMGGMGFTPQSQGGTHIVERNLTRLTVFVSLLFATNTIVLWHCSSGLQPGRRADAGDVEPGRRDRRHERADRVALAVEVARVHERHLAAQARARPRASAAPTR